MIQIMRIIIEYVRAVQASMKCDAGGNKHSFKKTWIFELCADGATSSLQSMVRDVTSFIHFSWALIFTGC